MERVTISVSDAFAQELATFMRAHNYENRSEAIRDLARLGLKTKALEAGTQRKDCVATLAYVFDSTLRDLPKRLIGAHHAHHALQIATLHVHLDDDQCLEVAVLRGEIAQVRALADKVTTQRGVVHGALSVIPTAQKSAAHRHGPASSPAAHDHA